MLEKTRDYIRKFPILSVIIPGLTLAAGGTFGTVERHLKMRAANFAKERAKETVTAVMNDPFIQRVKACDEGTTVHGQCLEDFYHDVEDIATEAQNRVYDLELEFREIIVESQNKGERLRGCLSELSAIKENDRQG